MKTPLTYLLPRMLAPRNQPRLHRPLKFAIQATALPAKRNLRFESFSLQFSGTSRVAFGDCDSLVRLWERHWRDRACCRSVRSMDRPKKLRATVFRADGTLNTSNTPNQPNPQTSSRLKHQKVSKAHCHRWDKSHRLATMPIPIAALYRIHNHQHQSLARIQSRSILKVHSIQLR